MPYRCTSCPEHRVFEFNEYFSRTDTVTLDGNGEETWRDEGSEESTDQDCVECTNCGEQAVEMDGEDVEDFDRGTEDGDDLEPIRDVK